MMRCTQVLTLLEDLGVVRLRDPDVFERFLLPAFSTMAPPKQRALRAYLLAHWPQLRQHDGLRAALQETPFVPVGDRLLRAREVLGPRVDVPSSIFSHLPSPFSDLPPPSLPFAGARPARGRALIHLRRRGRLPRGRVLHRGVARASRGAMRVRRKNDHRRYLRTVRLSGT